MILITDDIRAALLANGEHTKAGHDHDRNRCVEAPYGNLVLVRRG